MTNYEPILEPEVLSRLFIERINEGDINSLMLLYEPDAVLVINAGKAARDSDSIREIFQRLINDFVERNVLISSTPFPPLQRDSLTLISRRFEVKYARKAQQSAVRSGVINEVSQRQSDSTWLFIMTQILFDAV